MKKIAHYYLINIDFKFTININFIVETSKINPKSASMYCQKLLITFLVVFISFFFTSTSIAQTFPDEITSLRKKISEAKDDSLKAKHYLKLGKEYQTLNPDSALICFLKALEIGKRKEKKSIQAIAYANLCSYYLRKNKNDLAKLYVDSSIVIAINLTDKLPLAMAYTVLSSYYFNQSEIKKALSYSLQSLKIREDAKDTAGLATSYIVLAETYQQIGKLAQAEKYALQSLSYFKFINSTRYEINAMHTLANIYGQSGEYQKALNIDRKALVLCNKSNSLLGKGMIFSNMANCYMYMGKTKEAIYFHKEVLKIDQKFGNKQHIADTYLNIGNAYLLNKEAKNSLPWLELAVALFKEVEFPKGESDAAQLLSEAYRSLGNYKKAFEFKEIQLTLSDNILNTESNKQIAELQTQYDTEKKNQTIQNLNQENTIQKLKINSQDIYLYMGSVLLLLSTVVGFMLHNRAKLKQESKFQNEIILQQDAASGAIVEAEERESKRIAGELHDGVGQLFATVKLNLSGLNSEMNFNNEYAKNLYTKTIDLVDDACAEVRSISHNLMPNVLLKAGLASAIREFISKIDEKQLRVNLETIGLNEKIDIKIETVLYRVIQELVNNVIKHAKANILDIQITLDEGAIVATIEDNGKGFNTDNIKNSEGIGLKNIKSRVDFLKGSVEWDSAIGRGTVVSIYIPLN